MAPVLEHAAVLGRQLIDPRGRCNRQGLLALTVIALTVQAIGGTMLALAGKPLDGALAMSLNAPIFWIGAMAVLKRLHDMGRTGWWVLAMSAAWIVWAFVATFVAVALFGQNAIAEGSLGFWIVFAAIVLPAFGGLLYLHAAPGDAEANKYGEVPGPTGFSPAPKREPLVPATVTA